MSSINITKPTKWSWATGSIETPSDATDLVLLEPFWAVDDWAITNGSTHIDLTGKTVTVTNTSDFAWVTDANVGPALSRISKDGNANGLNLNDAALNSTKVSLLLVIRRPGTDTGLWYAAGNDLYAGSLGLRFKSTGEIEVYDFGTNSTDATSTGTVGQDEWHAIGITFDIDTDTVKFFIDGATAGSGSTDRSFNAVRRLFYYVGTQNAISAGFRCALWAEWAGSAVKSDSFMLAITADPYRLLRQAGGGTPSTSPSDVSISLSVQAPSVSYTGPLSSVSPSNVSVALSVQEPTVSYTSPGAVSTSPSNISAALVVQAPSISASTPLSSADAGLALVVNAPSVSFTSAGSFSTTPSAVTVALSVSSPSATFNPPTNVPVTVQNVTFTTTVSSVRASIPGPVSAKRHAHARGVNRSVNRSNKR